MPKSNTNHLRVATSHGHWVEIDNRIRHSVANLAGTNETAEMLLLLVDLMTNERYDALDRWCVIHEVQQEALKYTTGFDDFLSATIEAISPTAKKAERKAA